MKMTLIQKLKVKTGTIALVNSPSDIFVQFEQFQPTSSIPVGAKEYFDFVLLFATGSEELKAFRKKIIPALKNNAVFWIACPKKSSGVPSDLAGVSGGGLTAHAGSPWQPVAAASIDSTWTGIRFKYAPNLENERRERSEEDLCDADGTLVVDRSNRIVHPPKDLAALFSNNAEARRFFDGLSFTNKREYVSWIVEAKKSETRTKRVMAAFNKILSKRKNP